MSQVARKHSHAGEFQASELSITIKHRLMMFKDIDIQLNKDLDTILRNLYLLIKIH